MFKLDYSLLKLTIGKKLILLIAMLLCLSVGALTWLSSKMYRADTEALVKQMTSDDARHLSESLRLEILALEEQSRSVGFFLLQNPTKDNEKNGEKSEALAEIKEDKPLSVFTTREQYAKQLSEKDPNLYGVIMFEDRGDSSLLYKDALVLEPLQKLSDTSGKNLAGQISSLNGLTSLNKGDPNEVNIFSVTASDDKRVLILFLPFYKDEISHKSYYLATAFSQNAWLERVRNDSLVSSFVIDQDGAVVAHPDSSLAQLKHNLSNLEIVKRVLEGKLTNGQVRYWDEEEKENKIGAFSLVGLGRLAVVSEIPESRAFEATARLQYRSILIAISVFFMSCMIGFVFAKSLAWPLRQLVGATEKLAAGDFTPRTERKGSDEVAQLTRAFNRMAEGLAERERVKEVFAKFHNKEIAEKILSGQVKLGGEKKEAVILFSDIRSFTSMSEELPPEEVVAFLNEYMTQMVSLIRFHGGIVDKYIGDAIMALWGVPISTGDDAGKAVKACLDMREKLAKMNEQREANGKKPIYIGMGLNLGEVIVGNIGSEEKMEYTVIGDAVNSASRIESMTKELGTDLLISQSIADKIQDRYLLVPCEKVKLKGKNQLISLYQVTGYKNGAGEMIKVESKYCHYIQESKVAA